MMDYKLKAYNPHITATVNRKGVLDIDTIKGCRMGMERYPVGGCYGLCYAAKMARVYGFNFKESVSRLIERDMAQLKLWKDLCLGGSVAVFNMVKRHKLGWFRVGTMGDPCHNWPLTIDLCEWLGRIKTPVIVTKHWFKIPEEVLLRFRAVGVVFNTSLSALDTEAERVYRLGEFNRLKASGIKSVLRVVSCKFGDTVKGKKLIKIQKKLFKNYPTIDNPLRIPQNDKRVVAGDILVERRKDLQGKTCISINNNKTYIGHCGNCPDQCGVL